MDIQDPILMNLYKTQQEALHPALRHSATERIFTMITNILTIMQQKEASLSAAAVPFTYSIYSEPCDKFTHQSFEGCYVVASRLNIKDHSILLNIWHKIHNRDFTQWALDGRSENIIDMYLQYTMDSDDYNDDGEYNKAFYALHTQLHTYDAAIWYDFLYNYPYTDDEGADMSEEDKLEALSPQIICYQEIPLKTSNYPRCPQTVITIADLMNIVKKAPH